MKNVLRLLVTVTLGVTAIPAAEALILCVDSGETCRSDKLQEGLDSTGPNCGWSSRSRWPAGTHDCFIISRVCDHDVFHWPCSACLVVANDAITAKRIACKSTPVMTSSGG